MRQHEKFILLSEYYETCFRVEEFGAALDAFPIWDEMLYVHRTETKKAELIRQIVKKFYAGRIGSTDEMEMHRELEKVYKLAKASYADEKRMTEKELFELFERDCIDDDEEEAHDD